MKTILLLEDDKGLNRGISLKLEKEGYRVFSAFSLAEAKKYLDTYQVDLLISDVTLPDGNGMDFCREVRKKSNVLLIFLTALDQEVDIVNGYDIGADDYIIKPFSLLVLIAKVHAIMRRAEQGQGNLLLSGELEVNCSAMQVYSEKQLVLLSKREIQLLLYLLEHAGQIVTKEQLLEQIWDFDGQFVEENTVTVTISRLKSKLKTKAISNIRGLGYLWTETVIRK